MLNYASEMARVYYALTNQALSAIPTGHTPAYWTERCYRYQASLPDVISGGRNASFWLEQWYYFRTGQNHRRATGTLADWFWLAKLYDQVLRGANHNPNGQVGYASAEFWAEKLAGVPGLGGGASALHSRLAQFEGAGDEVALRKISATTLHFYQHLGNRKYYNVELGGTLSIGGEFLRIKKKRIALLARGYGAAETPAITYSGSWSNVADASLYKGNWRYSDTANAYAQFTTPANSEWVGARVPALSNAGVVKVTINGDATLADLLSTAQQLVDAGTLASTVLVANGGTLNPTDRIWNQYNNSADTQFTRSLPPGTHTVRITRTDYKQAASSGTFAALNLFYAGGSTIRTATEAPDDAYWIELQKTFDAVNEGSAEEISYFITPTGAGGGEWIGHQNSLKFTVLPTYTVDGVSDTLATWETLVGQEITISMQFGARHTFTGSTNIALMDVEYRMNATTGYWIEHTLNWDTTGITYGYPAMMTLNALLDKCRGIDTAVATLNANNDAHVIQTQQNTLWSWDEDGNQGAILYIPDLTMTVNNWIDVHDSSTYFFFKDIAADAGSWNKAYVTRAYPNPYVTLTGSEIWQSEANYRVQWFADANAELAS